MKTSGSLVATHMGLAQGDREPGLPAAIQFAEPRVTVSVRIALDVLVPQDR